MSNEIKEENIFVEQGGSAGPYVYFKTERSVILQEYFPSVEKARRSKIFTEWTGVGMGAFYLAAGIASVIQGLNYIALGIRSRDSDTVQNVIFGFQLVALGGFFLKCSDNAINASILANRQRNRLVEDSQ